MQKQILRKYSVGREALRSFTLSLIENYKMQLKNQQYNKRPNSVQNRVSAKRMGGGQAKTLQNGSGIGNGFNRRILVLDGIARPVVTISGAEVEGRLLWIPSSAELFSGRCDRVCRWVAFEGGSKLSRLEKYAFSETGLTAVHIPASVEVICEKCFSSCTPLRSVTFAVDCQLSRLEQAAFYETDLTTIHIPEIGRAHV
jgi:hypothetical protein